MRQLKANSDGQDAVIEGKTLVVIDGQDSIKQSIQRRLLTVRGAYRYNLDSGVPYVERILGKGRSLEVIRAVITEAVRESPGVTEVVEVDLQYNRDTRNLKASITVRATDQGIVQLNVPIDIETLSV